MTSVQSCLRSITPELWHAIGVGTGVAVAFVVVVGLITGGIDTPIIERRTPLLAIDYPIWVVNAALIGALSGLSVYARSRLIEHGGNLRRRICCGLCRVLPVVQWPARRRVRSRRCAQRHRARATVHRRCHHAVSGRAPRPALAHLPRRLRELRGGAGADPTQRPAPSVPSRGPSALGGIGHP